MYHTNLKYLDVSVNQDQLPLNAVSDQGVECLSFNQLF